MARTKKRSDGRLQSKIYLGMDAEGKKKYKYVYAATQKELQAKVDEVKLKIGKGIDISSEKDTFKTWGDRWLKKKSSSVSENWYVATEINYRKLEPIFNVSVCDLRCADLEDILVDLQHNGYSNRVLQAVKQIAVGIMKECVKNRVIEYNPFTDAEMPKAKPSSEEPRRALTAAEQQWIVDTPHRAQTAAMIMMYSGLRRGELIPLTWPDIDLENRTISVNKSVQMIKGHPCIRKSGKSDAAMRTVSIPQRLADYLRQQPKDSLLVVHMLNGKMYTSNAWRSLWDSYMKELNFKYGDFLNRDSLKKNTAPIVIPPFTAHWLRHTFITLMYMSGVDVLTASKQAGHSDIKITMEIYTHLDSEFEKKSIDKLDKYLAEGCQMGVG